MKISEAMRHEKKKIMKLEKTKMDTVRREKERERESPNDTHTHTYTPSKIEQTTLEIKISTFYDQKWVYNCGADTHRHTPTHSVKEIYAVVRILLFSLPW